MAVSGNATTRNTEEKAYLKQLSGEGGAKAYAPFGAGRKTGHQIPVVAAKGGEKGRRYAAELKPNSVRKKGKKKREGEKRRGKGEEVISGVVRPQAAVMCWLALLSGLRENSDGKELNY